MFCPKCGKQVDESDTFCRSCGRSLSAEKPAPTGIAPASVGAGTVGVGKAVEPTKRSGEATASLILGLFSFIPIVGLLAVIFGHMALASIRRSGGRLLGNGMAAFGLSLGYLGLGGWIIYGLTVVINPLLPSSLRRQNEMLVVGSLRTIKTACTTYAVTYHASYPPSLAALGPPKGLNPDATGEEIQKAVNAQAAGLLDEILTSGTKSGYRFTYVAGEVSAPMFKGETGRIDTYAVHADPVTPGVTGDNHYFTDESGVIRMEWQKQANAHSPPLHE